ncbi:MAG: hypothetical protein IPO92_00600 [Saprospiraceae bacterium]|nr:hypothetical protein [Saprospiraceae bacterium]
MKSKTPTWAIITAVFIMLIGGCGIKNDIQSIKIRDIIAMKDNIFNAIDKDNMENLDTSIVKTSNVDSITPERVDTTLVVNDTMSGKDSITSLTGKEDKNEREDVKKMLNEVFTISEKMIGRFIIFGYIGLIFSVLLIVGGLFLLIKKSFSIKLVYAAIGANILFSLVRWIMLTGEEIKRYP